MASGSPGAKEPSLGEVTFTTSILKGALDFLHPTNTRHFTSIYAVSAKKADGPKAFLGGTLMLDHTAHIAYNKSISRRI
jgi:hypothetical protein